MYELTLQQESIQEDLIFIQNLTPVDWALLRNARILISGGTGYYGKWFLSSFLYINKTLQLNAKLYIISRTPESFISNYPIFAGHDELIFIQGDIRNFNFPNGNFNYIIHAATEVATTQEADAPQEMLNVAEDGTRHILEFAKTSGFPKILLTSSGAVYGTQPPDIMNIKEKFTKQPYTVYGKTKKCSEELLRTSGIPHSIARCYASVGPWLGLDIQYAIGNFILDVIKNQPVIIKSDGRPLRSYLYIADLISWLWTILLKGENGMAYNVGSDKAISIAELAHKVAAQKQGYSGKIIIQKEPDWNAPAPRYVPDTTLARESLGLKEHFTLEEGIQRTMTFARQEQICGNK